MTDREMLELAAKAAGQERSAAGDLWSNARGQPWNPLTDDGDALRLAVKLEMQVCVGVRRIDAVIVGDEEGQVFRGTEAKDGDICAATRHVITRAAAELGKAMP